MSVSRHVVKRVLAIEQAEVCIRLKDLSCRVLIGLKGDGARVRRSIGSMYLRNLSPFLMQVDVARRKGLVVF